MSWAWCSSFCCYSSMRSSLFFPHLPCASHPGNGNAAHQSELGQCFLFSSVLLCLQITLFFLPYSLHYLFFLWERAEVRAQLPELFPRFLLMRTGKMKDRERWGRKYTELICKATLNVSSVSSFCFISSPLQSLENCQEKKLHACQLQYRRKAPSPLNCDFISGWMTSYTCLGESLLALLVLWGHTKS